MDFPAYVPQGIREYYKKVAQQGNVERDKLLVLGRWINDNRMEYVYSVFNGIFAADSWEVFFNASNFAHCLQSNVSIFKKADIEANELGVEIVKTAKKLRSLLTRFSVVSGCGADNPGLGRIDSILSTITDTIDEVSRFPEIDEYFPFEVFFNRQRDKKNTYLRAVAICLRKMGYSDMNAKMKNALATMAMVTLDEESVTYDDVDKALKYSPHKTATK